MQQDKQLTFRCVRCGDDVTFVETCSCDDDNATPEPDHSEDARTEALGW